MPIVGRVSASQDECCTPGYLKTIYFKSEDFVACTVKDQNVVGRYRGVCSNGHRMKRCNTKRRVHGFSLPSARHEIARFAMSSAMELEALRSTRNLERDARIVSSMVSFSRPLKSLEQIRQVQDRWEHRTSPDIRRNVLETCRIIPRPIEFHQTFREIFECSRHGSTRNRSDSTAYRWSMAAPKGRTPIGSVRRVRSVDRSLAVRSSSLTATSGKRV